MLSLLQTRANPPPSKYSWQFFSSAPGDPSTTKPDKVFEQSGYESEVGVGARLEWTRLPAMLSQGLESRLSYRVSSDQDYGRIVCRWGVLWLVRFDKYSVCFNWCPQSECSDWLKLYHCQGGEWSRRRVAALRLHRDSFSTVSAHPYFWLLTIY